MAGYNWTTFLTTNKDVVKRFVKETFAVFAKTQWWDGPKSWDRTNKKDLEKFTDLMVSTWVHGAGKGASAVPDCPAANKKALRGYIIYGTSVTPPGPR